MAIEQIRILRVQGRPEGMELVTSALARVASAAVKVTQASDGMTAAATTQTSKVLSLTKQWESYQARTDLAARAQQQFGRDITSVTRFFEQGTIGASRYAQEVDRIKTSLQGAGTQSGLPKIDQSTLNKSLGISDGVQNSAKEVAVVFEQEFKRLEEIAVAKAAHLAQVTQHGIAEAFGINAIRKSAQESASVLAAEFDRIEEIAKLKANHIAEVTQRGLNAAFGIGAPGAMANGAGFSALEEQFNKLEAIATAKAAHIAQVTQQGIGAAFGVGAAPGRSARDAAAFFEELAAAEDKAAAKAASLRAAINPLDAEFAKLGKELAEYRNLMNAGAITATEFEHAQVMAGKRLSDFAANLKNGANAGRVMSGELVNLSYQLNDVVTGLLLGQSPFMIVAQQGGQVIQILQNSKASVVDFAKEAGSKLLGYLSVSRLVFGGVAAAVGAGVLALNDFAAAQSKVALGLTGAGRASGSSIGSINQTAHAGSSLTGLSVSEARELATALAQTGRVANENILPIVKMGKDIATAFGTDAAGAVEILAKAFSDPTSGADTLNQRLGFLDAAMQRQIANLVAQNRLWDAQKVLTAGLSSSLADVNNAVSTSSKFWTALGNIISDAWDKVGEGAARVTGIGLKIGLDEQLKIAQSRLEELQKIAANRSEAANKALGTSNLLDQQKAKVDELTAALQRYGQASIEAQQRQFSFAQASAIRSERPQIDAVEKLTNAQELLVKTLIDVQTSGGPASEILKRIGLSYQQLADAVAIASGNLKTFKSEFQTQSDALKIANQAITAFSPSAKGDIAKQQSLEATLSAKMTPEEKATLAQQAYTNAVKQATTALSESARQRALTSNQAIDSVKLESELLGKTIGQQAELRANLQARQQLEQEASQNRTAFDNAQYERLKKINAELGKQTQKSAFDTMNESIRFGRSTALLSPEDASIAQQLKGLYPDVAEGLNSVQAAGLRANSALSAFSSAASSTLVTGLSDIFDGTKSVSQGFADMSKSILRSLEEMLVKAYIVLPIFRALQVAMGGGNLLGILGNGGAALGPTSVGGAPLSFADGGYTGAGAKYEPAGIVHRGEYVLDAATTNRIGVPNLNRLRGYAEGGLVTPMYRQDNSAPSKSEINIYGASNPQAVDVKETIDGKGNRRVDIMFDEGVASALARGPATRRSMGSNFAGKSVGVRR